VRDAPIGIWVSVVVGAGSAIIANKLISGASRGAILGMKYDEAATEDLARGGTRRGNCASAAIRRFERLAPTSSVMASCSDEIQKKAAAV
jgi:hypothetical protein